MTYNPSLLQRIGPINAGPRRYFYKSEDAMTTVRAAGYFADGQRQGMQVGDRVTVITVNSSNVVQTAYESVVLSLTSGAADIADGTSLTVTNT